MAKLIFIWMALLVAGTAAAWLLWNRSLEQPGYTVVAETDAYELRRYDGYVVAETSVSGSFEESGNEAFRVLAAYIFGRNTAAAEMAMTAPVISYGAADNRADVRGERMAMTAPVFSTLDGQPGPAENGERLWTYQFVMERRFSPDNLPQPVDPRVSIRQVPPRLVAVRRFSGRWLWENVAEEEAKLVAALRNDGLIPLGKVALARYNDPFTPYFLRRNEVMVNVAEPSRTAAPRVEV